MVLCNSDMISRNSGVDQPSVPITTLAGVASLSTLLPDLPLPSPLSTTLASDSILGDIAVENYTNNLLESSDGSLAREVINVVQRSNMTRLELKEPINYNSVPGNPPLLLRTMLGIQPGLFTPTTAEIPPHLHPNIPMVNGNDASAPIHDLYGQLPGSYGGLPNGNVPKVETNGSFPISGSHHPGATNGDSSTAKKAPKDRRRNAKTQKPEVAALTEHNVDPSMKPRLCLPKIDEIGNFKFTSDMTVDLSQSKLDLKPNRKSPAVPEMVLCLPKIDMQHKDNPILKRFREAIYEIVDNSGQLDLMDEDSEYDLIRQSVLNNLVYESATLKKQGDMQYMSFKKLTRFLLFLQLVIRSKKRNELLQTWQNVGAEDDLSRRYLLEKLILSLDASQLSLNIMTSSHMPKEVFIEDVIESILFITKFVTSEIIFPEFDPVYRIHNKEKSYASNLKQKRAKASTVKNQSILRVYNRLTELYSSLADLIQVQEFTDTIVLQTSGLAVAPIFVENISELQLNSIKLLTYIFSRYDKHRQLIVDDILSSLARLPSSKKNLRQYRLGGDTNIQMVTALMLQLIQSMVVIPPNQKDCGLENESSKKDDRELIMQNSFQCALRTAHSFLTIFLQKCATKGDEDYKPLFENFVYDLLTAVNKPEWPAAEFLLNILGTLLVNQFSNKQLDMGVRTASLEYLGIVASRLRKDAVNTEELRDAVTAFCDEQRREEEREEKRVWSDLERLHLAKKMLLSYLFMGSQTETALVFARRFYLGLWFRDISLHKSSQLKDSKTQELDVDAELEKMNKEKKFLLKLMGRERPNKEDSRRVLDYNEACVVSRFLATQRPFSRSFDLYLNHILKVLRETAIAVRTKAMKCLTAVVEADPTILARADCEKAVHGRFLDQSTAVREAAVDLVGKFILIRPQLTSQYYKMLLERILDTGISVRKRVIKIFRDICIEQPEFAKIPEICVNMIRRVNDEEGIKKLVNETFYTMWFVPVTSRDSSTKLLRRVINITDVVIACKDSTGYEWFEQLLGNLFKKDDTVDIQKACKQIVDALVQNVMRLEEIGVENKLVAALVTLFLFCKVNPNLVVQHVMVLHPYLSIKCSAHQDTLVLHYVASIMELAVPRMDHPSAGFLKALEEDLVKLVLRHGMMVVQSCVDCLGAIVNGVTKNFDLIKECFKKFYGVLMKLKLEIERNPHVDLGNNRSTLLRSLFTIGLFARNFDFDSADFGGQNNGIRHRVFEMLYFYVCCPDEEIRHKALTGIGSFCVRHYDEMLNSNLKDLYHEFLTNEMTPLRLKIQVLQNIQMYLTEEEKRMIQSEDEYNKQQDAQGGLKEMGDVQSGMASTVIQLYVKQLLEAYIHENYQVRLTSMNVIALVLRQGLVHPVQMVPYLVAMASDPDVLVRTKADQHLQDIEKKYPGFLQMKSIQGMRMSFRLHLRLGKESGVNPLRGVRQADDAPIAVNHFIYTCLRSKKDQRRAVVTSLLSFFDDVTGTALPELLYIADNVAHFPYQILDEPMFIIHHIDTLVSISGSNLLQNFKELFFPSRGDFQPLEGVENAERLKAIIDEDEEADIETLEKRLPDDVTGIRELLKTAQRCLLALLLKNHLKDSYAITDQKLHHYSPVEAKTYDKPISRRSKASFTPKATIEALLSETDNRDVVSVQERMQLIADYLDFKQLMLSIDPVEHDPEDASGDIPDPLHAKETDAVHNSRYGLYSQRFTAALTEKAPRTPRAEKHKARTSEKKKPKKKRRRKESNSSDDSDLDPDWT